MKVFITGGAGFIGSELVRQSLQRGFQVVVADSLVNGKLSNISDCQGPNLSFFKVDVRNTPSITEIMRGCDVIFHLACLGVRHSLHSPLENHDVNASATLTLLSIAQKLGVPRFNYISTSEVFGTGRYVPMKEDHPLAPHTVYGASKLAGECYTRAFFDTYRYSTTVIRPFNSFGPRSHHEGDCGEVIPKYLLRALCDEPLLVFGDGKQTRDFTFVEDTARGILDCGISEKTLGHTINIGSGTEIEIRTLAKIVLELVPGTRSEIVHVDPRPGDVLRLYADVEKAKRLVNFVPIVPLRAGLERVLQWYKDTKIDPRALFAEDKAFNWQT